MGLIRLPARGPVYFDTMCFIYSVERHPVYRPLLLPVWTAVRNRQFRIASSELAIVETLVAPYRAGDAVLESQYEQTLSLGVLDLHRISPTVLRRAASMRAAASRLRTPDAIHAATALEIGATIFITNDPIYRQVPGLQVELLSEVVLQP